MIPQDWEIPEAISTRFGRTGGRQRAMYADGHLIIVLHKVPEPDSLTRTAAFFWRKPDGTWVANADAESSGLDALDEHLECYERTITGLEAAHEAACTSTEHFYVLERIGAIDRAARNLVAALQSAREQFGNDLTLINIRDRALEISRTAELARADSKNGLEYAIARQAEQQARITDRMATAAHRLNIVAAIFFPLTALGGLLGMNMHNGLEKLPIWSFWLVLCVGFLVGLLVSHLVTRPTSASVSPNR